MYKLNEKLDEVGRHKVVKAQLQIKIIINDFLFNYSCLVVFFYHWLQQI